MADPALVDPAPCVEVALPLPVHHPFTYRLPQGVRLPEPGTRVLVPFQRGERIGWVVGPGTPPEGVRRILELYDVLETEPSATPALLRLARWISAYHVTPLGIVLRTILPSVLSDESKDVLVRTEMPAPNDLAEADQVLLEAAAAAKHGIGLRRLRSVASHAKGGGALWPRIRRLIQGGLLLHRVEPPRTDPALRIRKVVRVVDPSPDLGARIEMFRRSPRQRELLEGLEALGGARELSVVTGDDGFSRGVVTGLERLGVVEVIEEERLRDPFEGRPSPDVPSVFVPTPEQQAAIDALTTASQNPGSPPFVLHGITGSGKTLVYMELLREVVERQGRSAMVLVPEIALTPQTVARFRGWFGDRVAVLHSGLSDGERYDAWRQLRSGEKPIVVGARSALFAPLPNLGAVVVDEEHDGSYKQSEAPRYHARDLAVVRGQLEGAVVVLGSATPSLESWKNVERGKFQRLHLPNRAGAGRLPRVEVVDLRTLKRSGTESSPRSAAPNAPDPMVLSPKLVDAVASRLAKGEQAILLLNRRGYSSFVQCRGCGEVEQCPNCSVSLTYHRRLARLRCHHCRHEAPAPTRCPRCGGTDLSFRGLGTEQVERIVSETFPMARIARMDVDTTGGKWAHADILGRVERREVDLLLGTQMIAKGLDFPNVTLVGVINADVGLHLPDFRSSERTFQLLAQVAGRAGRGALAGEVILQTSLPDHHAISCALTHDYETFATHELADREHPPYPPHRRLVNLITSSPDPEKAALAAERGAAWWRELADRGGLNGLEVVGPAPCPIERLHGRTRWHFFLRLPVAGGPQRVSGALRNFVEASGVLPSGDVRLAVDRDPVALL